MAGIADFLQGMFRPPQADPWAGMRQQGAAVPMGAQPPMNADPMQGMGAIQRLEYMRQNNPEALMGLASGLMQGNLGGGFAAAGQAMGEHRKEYRQQAEKTRTNDLTRKWLLGRGLSESDADAALASPAIMQSLMKGDDPQALMNTGEGIYDPNTKEWIMPPGGQQAKAPQLVEIFDEKTGQPYKAIWDASIGDYRRVGGIKQRTGWRMNPETGQMEEVAADAPNLKEFEGKNSGFYLRASESDKIVSEMESEATLGNKLLDAAPFGLGNFGKSDNAQLFEQGKRDFINAILRRESGAVISESEFDNADKQYFPQPGDSEAVKQQKAANRANAIEGLRVSSGQGANLVRPQGGGKSVRDMSDAELEAIVNGQ